MFSGIGGFELGLPKEWECVGYSEINKYADKVYQFHFPNHKNYGDATKIDAEQLPNFDLICGGFPCQSFSIAGKRKGFSDKKKPAYLINGKYRLAMINVTAMALRP